MSTIITLKVSLPLFLIILGRYTDVVYVKRFDFYLIYDSMRRMILKLDSNNILRPFLIDIQGSRAPGKTIKIDKAERYLFINSRNKVILIAELHPESITGFIEAKNTGPSSVKEDITDFVPLNNDRLITLNRNGLINLWRFNVFKEDANSIYEIQIKKDVPAGIFEEFVSLEICDNDHHLSIMTTYGFLMNRNRIFLAWVTDQDYMYLLTEKFVRDEQFFKKRAKLKEE